jgi:hypothetical protein
LNRYDRNNIGAAVVGVDNAWNAVKETRDVARIGIGVIESCHQQRPRDLPSLT